MYLCDKYIRYIFPRMIRRKIRYVAIRQLDIPAVQVRGHHSVAKARVSFVEFAAAIERKVG